MNIDKLKKVVAKIITISPFIAMSVWLIINEGLIEYFIIMGLSLGFIGLFAIYFWAVIEVSKK